MGATFSPASVLGLRPPTRRALALPSDYNRCSACVCLVVQVFPPCIVCRAVCSLHAVRAGRPDSRLRRAQGAPLPRDRIQDRSVGFAFVCIGTHRPLSTLGTESAGHVCLPARPREGPAAAAGAGRAASRHSAMQSSVRLSEWLRRRRVSPQPLDELCAGDEELPGFFRTAVADAFATVLEPTAVQSVAAARALDTGWLRAEAFPACRSCPHAPPRLCGRRSTTTCRCCASCSWTRRLTASAPRCGGARIRARRADRRAPCRISPSR
jgi:hypothetical protein